jgi:hypothetical protein
MELRQEIIHVSIRNKLVQSSSENDMHHENWTEENLGYLTFRWYSRTAS